MPANRFEQVDEPPTDAITLKLSERGGEAFGHVLCPADLAGCGRGGVVRHVLRLERPHLQAAIREEPAQAGDDQRLPDIGAGAKDHDRGNGGMGHAPA